MFMVFFCLFFPPEIQASFFFRIDLSSFTSISFQSLKNRNYLEDRRGKRQALAKYPHYANNVLSKFRFYPFNAQEDTGGPFHQNFNFILRRDHQKNFL